MSSRLTLETIVKTLDQSSPAYKALTRAGKMAEDQINRTRAAAQRPVRASIAGATSGGGIGHGSGGRGGGSMGSLANAGGALGSIGEVIKGVGNGIPILEQVLGIYKGIAIAAAAAATSAALFGYAASQAAADQEALKLSLEAITGSAAIAGVQLSRLKEIARLPGLGFEEAVRGSVALQSVGADARFAERAMVAFSNAVALAGGGKEDLQGVMRALTQIASKGKVSAEEVNQQLAERLPQLRKAMMAAFGTADTEKLQEMGVTSAEFISKIVDEFDKLPKVAGGARNAMDNLSDSVKNALAAVGSVINRVLAPAVDEFGTFLNQLADTGVLADITERFLGAAGAAAKASAEFGKTTLASFRAAVNVGGKLADVMGLPAPGNAEAADAATVGIRTIDFLSEAKDAGDFLKRAASVVLGAFSVLPDILRPMFQLGEIFLEQARLKIELVGAIAADFLDRLAGFNIVGFKPFGLGAGGSERQKEITARQGKADAAADRLRSDIGVAMNAALARGKQIFEDAEKAVPSDAVKNDRSPGSLITATERTAKATEEMLKIQREQKAIGDRILNGGQVGGQTLNKVNLSRYERGTGPVGRGSNSKEERLLRQLLDAMAESRVGAIVDSRRLNWGR